MGIMVFAIYQGTGMGRKWQTVPLPTMAVLKVTPVPTIDTTSNMELFENAKFKYSIMKPMGWEVTAITTDKNFDDRQVFLPEVNKQRGNIVEISVTVISKPGNLADLGSEADFNKWLASPTNATDSSGLVKKYGEKMVEGNRAVVLWQDKELPEGYDFSIMTWIRRGKVNYYIDALGDGKFSDQDSGLFDFISGSFKSR